MTDSVICLKHHELFITLESFTDVLNSAFHGLFLKLFFFLEIISSFIQRQDDQVDDYTQNDYYDCRVAERSVYQGKQNIVNKYQRSYDDVE